jgi:hypothetical protein
LLHARGVVDALLGRCLIAQPKPAADEESCDATDPGPSRATWRTASSRLDAAPRLGVRTAVTWSPFSLGEVLPSTVSAGGKPPLFDRFIGTTPSSDASSACTLIVRLSAFMSRTNVPAGHG